MEIDKTQILEKIDTKLFRLIGRVADEMQMECYVIGGYVRDIFLYRPSKDIDIVVVGSGVKFAKSIAKALGHSAKLTVFPNFGTAQVKHHGTEVEFVGARRESYRAESRKPIIEDGTLQEDQQRRDFSINALAIALNTPRWGELVDPFDGLTDMENLTLRTPLDPDITFSDDPLRMLRAIRFASQLGFDIAPETFEAIQRNTERVKILSGERIAEELNKIMLSPRPSVGLNLLQITGLLPLILPELEALRGVETKFGISHKDNYLHTLQVVDQLALKSDNLWLRWAALLHDIAKPNTKHFDPKLGWTFHNHNFIGEKMVATIFRRLTLPQNEKLKFVKKMVLLHMRPIALVEEEVTDSAIRRLLFEAGDDLEELMMLAEADITSKNEGKVRRYLENYHLVRRKLKEIEEKDRVRNFQPPVSGEEIMQWYGLKPCREVGTLKAVIKDAILDGIIPNERNAAVQLLAQEAANLGLTPHTEQ